jgi:hypothetical protein
MIIGCGTHCLPSDAYDGLGNKKTAAMASGFWSTP